MRIIKFIKITIVGLISFALCLCCLIPIGQIKINNSSKVDESEQSLPSVSDNTEVSKETLEYSEVEESEEPNESFFTEESCTETSDEASEPDESYEEQDESDDDAVSDYEDIVSDISVRLYNDFSIGLNSVDGEAYIRDIASLLTKHAPVGLRISAGCAMAYTEGGAGKYGIYVKTNNCFGIMATPGWDGWVYSRTTGLVYRNFTIATRYGAKGLFRAYPTIEESVVDYINLIMGEHYNAVLTMDNDADYFNYVLHQGYGETHMVYTWLSLVNMYDLTQYNIDWSYEENSAESECGYIPYPRRGHVYWYLQ